MRHGWVIGAVVVCLACLPVAARLMWLVDPDEDNDLWALAWPVLFVLGVVESACTSGARVIAAVRRRLSQ